MLIIIFSFKKKKIFKGTKVIQFSSGSRTLKQHHMENICDSMDQRTGAPNNRFLLNTLKTLLNTFSSQEMHSKRRYKI